MTVNEIHKLAIDKLERSGLYGRTIDRWWTGFYHNGHRPDAIETLSTSRQEIVSIVIEQSRRG